MSDKDKLPESRIIVTFPNPNSVQTSFTLNNVSPMQLWAVARLLQHQGDTLYMSEQVKQARQAAENAAVADAIRQGGMGRTD